MLFYYRKYRNICKGHQSLLTWFIRIGAFYNDEITNELRFSWFKVSNILNCTDITVWSYHPKDISNPRCQTLRLMIFSDLETLFKKSFVDSFGIITRWKYLSDSTSINSTFDNSIAVKNGQIQSFYIPLYLLLGSICESSPWSNGLLQMSS